MAATATDGEAAERAAETAGVGGEGGDGWRRRRATAKGRATARDLRMGNRCREGDVVRDSTVQHKYRECEGAFVKLRRVPKSSVACQMSRPQLFCMNLLQQTSWRASFVGFFSFCMKLFPPLQVYVSIVVLTLLSMYDEYRCAVW